MPISRGPPICRYCAWGKGTPASPRWNAVEAGRLRQALPPRWLSSSSAAATTSSLPTTITQGRDGANSEASDADEEEGARFATQLQETIGDLEERWEGSPFFKMLSSPLRSCALTHQVLPTDLLLQLKPVRILPASAQQEVLLPDQVLHPRFASKKPGKGLWVTLNPTVLEDLTSRGAYKYLAPQAKVPPALGDFVTEQLHQRVLQEAELLSSRVRTQSRVAVAARLRTVPSSDSPRHGGTAESLDLTVTSNANEAAADDILTRQDVEGRPWFSAGLALGPSRSNSGINTPPPPQDAVPPLPMFSHRSVRLPPATDAQVPPADATHHATVPLYHLTSLPATADGRTLQTYLEHVQCYEIACVRNEEFRFEAVEAALKEREAQTTFYALRQSPLTVDLAVALWRLKLWCSTAEQ